MVAFSGREGRVEGGGGGGWGDGVDEAEEEEAAEAISMVVDCGPRQSPASLAPVEMG